MFNVLLVDDEPIILNGLIKLINWEDFGLEVSGTATDGVQALELLEQGNYHILITDVCMPKMSGLELLHLIRTRKMEIKVIMISGYDDFAYVKEALKYGIENYILKPIDEDELKFTLLNVMDKIESDANKQMLHEMLIDTLSDNILYRWAVMAIGHEELIERAHFLNINLSRRYYCVAVIRLYESEKKADQYTFDRASVKQLFMDLKLQNIDAHVTFNFTNDIILILGYDEYWNIHHFETIIKRIMEAWSYQTSSGWFAAIGSVSKDALLIHESYAQAIKLLSYSSITPEKTILKHDEGAKYLFNLYEAYNINLNILNNLFSISDEITAIQIIDQIFETMRKFDPSINEIYMLVGEVIYSIFISSSYEKNGLKDNELSECLSDMLGMSKLSDMQELIEQLVVKHMQGKLPNIRSMHPVVDEILSYVEENYDQDISLKTLAIHYNLSPTYLGQIFKSETGELFTDYLCNIRIENAKVLLTTTNLKSGDVARKVGFNNPNYFANVFKKMVGVYPTRYRKNQRTSSI